MRLLFDTLLVVVSLVIVVKTYNNLHSFKNVSLAAYVIFVCFVFNCLPIALDIFMGTPNYMVYFGEFERAANNDSVSIIYDIYMLVAMLVLYVYYVKNPVDELEGTFSYSSKFNIIQLLLIFSPLITYFIFIGSIQDLLLNSLLDRKAETNALGLINNLLFISLYFICIRYFGKQKNVLTIFALVFFLIMLTMISGKRFIVAVVLMCYFFSYISSRWQGKHKVSMTPILLVVGGLFMVFVVYYITNIKVMGDFSGYIYSQLRVDFGREDVTKFVLMREMEGHPILEYRGESVLSLLLMIVPRAIWPAKPFPHYRYLTSELYGVDMDELNSGMTPSIFEMMVANFGYIGMIIAILLLIAIIRFGDRLNNPNLRLLTLIVLIQLLTQSLDVILILFYIFIFLVLTKKHWIKNKTKLLIRDKYGRSKAIDRGV